MNLHEQHHHEDQNSVGEVGLPEPHQPGSRPPRADGLVEEADALYEGLGMGAYFPSLYDSVTPAPYYQPKTNAAENEAQPLGPDQCGPDQCGCGCGEEPLE